MAGKIQLTPAELLAQSQEMLSLQKEFESLFGQTNTLLTQVNQNWSANLANNFVGKLTSAQKGFANVIALLEQGGNMAATSAKTFESMDSLLSKVMNGDSFLGTIGGGIAGVAGTIGGIAGVAGGVTGFGGIAAAGGGVANVLKDVDWGKVGGVLSDFGEYAWEQLKNDWNTAGEGLEWMADKYGQLPEGVRDKIEDILGSHLTTSISITYDIITGNVSWDTAYDFIDEIFEGNVYGSAVIGTLKEVFEGDIAQRSSECTEKTVEEWMNGNFIAGTSVAIGDFIDTIGITSIDVLGSIGVDFVSGLPGVGLIEDALGFDISDSWDGLMDSAHEGFREFMDNTTDFISDVEEVTHEIIRDTAEIVVDTAKDVGKVVVDVVDTAWEGAKDAGKAVGNWIKGWF
ncbi:MAG: hypothetical protein IKT45_03415 [Lachnospiraceae bacterium]|nr:hypothetical protein [Lachnospiraceae bacterium]